MAAYTKKVDFFETAEGIQAAAALRSMSESADYNTGSSYSANTGEYPDNQIPFVDKHMNYLRAHPATDPRQYLANLKLMTRKR